MMTLKRMTILSLVVVVAMALTPTLVFAQAGGAGGAGGGATGGSPGSPSASISTTEFQGLHVMTGQVTKIDHNKGMFSVKTPEGTLDLHAPPAALAAINQGDQVEVQIGVRSVK